MHTAEPSILCTEYDNAARPEGTFQSDQLVFSYPPRSEIDWLHAVEACFVLQNRLAHILPLVRQKELLSLWIKLGREHPAILRQKVLDRRIEDSILLRHLLAWSWGLKGIKWKE
jgi:hypothetical protein